VPTTFLVASAVALAFTVNAFLPRRGRLFLLPSFISSWLTLELAPWWLFWQVAIAVLFIANGALEAWQGWLGLALTVASCGGLVVHMVVGRRTRMIVSGVVKDLDVTGEAPPFPRSHVAFPLLMSRRKGVRRIRNIEFARYDKKRLRLDVVLPEEPGSGRPGILQIHGGGWVMGDKREQAIPLLGHLAANGWVGINANYRLSPRATFPDHLVDLKRAVAWYREHAAEHGADPDFLCVTGGSAGGHLTALMALTANDPEYQPGFEDVDTSLRAAVPFYGVYDFTNRLGTWQKDTVKRFFGPIIMKKRLEDDPEAFAKASPIDRVRADAPPFLVIHGSRDTLAPVEDARLFVERLQAVSASPVLYAEMIGAQHAFEIFPSFRTAAVIEGVERFLTSIHQAYLAGREGEDVSEAEAGDDLVDASS
jgi:acetyl esterase/lipase